MLDTIYTYTAKRDKAKLMDAFKVSRLHCPPSSLSKGYIRFVPAHRLSSLQCCQVFDTEGTGKVSYETFEKEILVKIGEPMDETEVRYSPPAPRPAVCSQVLCFLPPAARLGTL